MDFSKLLTKALPWIGAAATGGAPALAMMAAKEVGAALGADVEPTADAIGAAVANATPEQMVALRDREATFKERMQQMGFQHEEELEKIGLDETKTLVADTQDARGKFAGDGAVFWLGISVLLTFAAVMGGSMFGSYLLLSGGITVKDVGVVAAVFGFLGTVVGYVAANAQQVVSFFFGSSRGSKQKTDAMADTFKKIGEAAAKK